MGYDDQKVDDSKQQEAIDKWDSIVAGSSFESVLATDKNAIWEMR